MSLLANSNAIESGGYNIDRSLRFRSSASAYLSRTPSSASNRKTWTYSVWVKRGQISGPIMLLLGSSDASNYTNFYFNSSNGFDFFTQTGGVNSGLYQTVATYRDPSAWYHVVLSIDTTASTKVNLYVNGVSQTLTISTAMSSSLDTWVNYNGPQYIGRNQAALHYFDGYLAEVNFIDGQALTPSSFGQTSTETGVWVPKKYTGTYGTNGFYLPFSDNTSATTLAYDKSGNGNNWTANNISTTAGATYDSMTDVPTLTSATAANYCTWNPVNKHSSLDIREGNLYIYTGTTAEGTLGTIGVSSGKWYFEFYPQATTGGWPKIGIAPSGTNANVTDGIFNTGYAYAANGTKRSPGSDVSYAASFSSGDIIGVALDMDAGTLTFYKNNVSQGTAFTGLSGTFSPAIMMYGGSYINFGQRPFSYTPPTGFKALNTFNLPDPTIKKPNQYMDVTAYTGNGGTQAITNGGFQPDFVWMKKRSAAESHILQNSTTGTTKFLMSNSTAAEDTSSAIIQSFDASGFTVGASSVVNGAATTYVGWQWKESATAGFDIVTYTGTGSAQNINHSLGVAPKMIITKSRNNATGWAVYHASFGNTGAGFLNGTGAWDSPTAAYWNNTTPTASVFTVGTANVTNFNTYTYVAYLFAEIPGFSKFGSYTGNGDADGPFVFCGFKPRFILAKPTTSANGWFIWDTSRDTYNVATKTLSPNASDAESSAWYNNIDVVSNGFKVRSYGYMNSGSVSYIYAAFAETPAKFSLAR